MTKSKQMGYFHNLAVFAIITLNLGLGVSYVIAWFIAGSQGLFWRADFSAFYTGGAIVAQGKGSELYNRELQTRVQQDILEGGSFQDGVLYFNNPPHAVFPFVCLANLPLSAAYYVWTFIQVMLFIWLLHILRRITKEFAQRERWLIISASLAMPSMMLNFILGSFSLFLLNCLLESYLALINSHEIRSGAWLGMAMIKPQSIVLPLIMFAGARKWHVIGGFFTISILWLAISTITFGWRVWIDFFQMVLSTSNQFDSFGVSPQNMYNLKGVLSLLLGNEHAVLINLISMLASLGAAGLVLILWIKGWEPNKPIFELKFAITILLGIFFSLHLNPQDGLLFILPVLLYYIYLRKCNHPLSVFACFALLCPIAFLLAEYSIAGNFGIRLPSLAMLMLGITMLKSLINERKGQNTSKGMSPAEL